MIHSTAIIDPSAKIADDVEISPYVVIGKGVEIDSGTWVGPHTVIQGPTKIGKNNKIFQFSSLGELPQDKKYNGEPTTLTIGDNNVIREFCTFNRGTVQDIGTTTLGNDNWIMAYVHLAHDCVVGNHTIFANNTTLAGHVKIKDYAILGGFTKVHQFCTIGEYAFTGMGTALAKDLPPFMMATDDPAKVRGVNREGLNRQGFSTHERSLIKEAYQILYRQDILYKESLSRLSELAKESPHVESLLTFCESSERGITR